MRLELTTSSLPRKCSTTELRQPFALSSGAKVRKKNEKTKKMCDFPDYFLSLLTNYNQKQMKRILIVGAGGQIGSEPDSLSAQNLRRAQCGGHRHARMQVPGRGRSLRGAECPRCHGDGVGGGPSPDRHDLQPRGAAFGRGERNPQMAWNVNMGALNNSLEVARQHHCALFTPLVDRRFRPLVAQGQDPAGYDHAADDDLRGLQGHGRACWATITTTSTGSIPVRSAFRASFRTSRCPAAARPTTPWRSTTRRSAAAVSPVPFPRTSIWT